VVFKTVCVSVILAAIAGLANGGEKPLTITDLMKMRTIQDPQISADGQWVTFCLKPDRSDGEVVVRSTGTGVEYRVPRGVEPVISDDGRWVAATVEPSLESLEIARLKDDSEAPRAGLALLDNSTGSTRMWTDVRSHAFSGGGRWLAVHRHADESDDENTQGADEGENGESRLGTTLILRHLASGNEKEVSDAVAFAFDEAGKWLAVAISRTGDRENRLLVFPLDKSETAAKEVHRADGAWYSGLAWPPENPGSLAFLAAQVEEDEPGDAALWVWRPGENHAEQLLAAENLPKGWHLPSSGEVEWSRDKNRVFIGLRPDRARVTSTPEANTLDTAFDAFDVEGIRKRGEIDVWHWNDPIVQSHQKTGWEVEKDRTYRALVNADTGELVQLADESVRTVVINDNATTGLGLADTPYLKELTWVGELQDVYVVDLATGSRGLVARRLWGEPSLSPDGKFVAFYRDGDWFLFDVGDGSARCATDGLEVRFADEDHDRPDPAPAYGLADWVDDGSAVLLYDRFDIWKVPTDGGSPVNLTGGEGRRRTVAYRVVDLDEDRHGVHGDERLLLTAYHHEDKSRALYALDLQKPHPKRLIDGEWTFTAVARAEHADRLLLTRERYDEFPDLWVADLEVSNLVRVSEANPQIADFAWGSARLVKWRSDDGVPLEGVLITPDGLEPGERCPVLVYFYRLSAHRLHLFNEPVVNHRPNFPLYASNGYAVFLPDIRFEVGRPGLSAVKCLVPGVQKLVELGVADPEAIGLHGHSWGGYQTAFVVTQTDIFAAAVAGAPVSNMTSAYGGIRYKTGRARQFQYEKSQSRLGVSLWQGRDRYIENSPLFYADRVRTPLLIQHGDADGAVPWTQSIELYLAMRRLGKECYLLQYRDEPHHLKKYPNKLDYTLKMMEFFDHHLKGEPAPEWMRDGVPYGGE